MSAIGLLSPGARERFLFHVKQLELWKDADQRRLAIAMLTGEHTERAVLAELRQGRNVANVDRHTVAHVDD